MSFDLLEESLHESEHARAARMTAVLEASRALSAETDPDGLCRRARQVLGAITGADTAHVLVYDDLARGWALPADGDRPELSVTEAARRGLVPLSAVEHAREPMIVDDVALDSRVGRDPYLAGREHCSLLVLPVLDHGLPRALVILENSLRRRAFTAGHLEAVRLIGEQLTVSLDNARAYATLRRQVAEHAEELAEARRRLQELTVTDALTRLPNRRKLDEFLEREWLRSMRSGQPIGVAMVDIDDFPRYTDHYGQQGGDHCLRLVADALRDTVRSTDLVARIGDSEFCVVMPGANQENASMIAERARRAVARLCEPHALAEEGIVTISIGVHAAGTVDVAGPGRLVELATEALHDND